MGMDKLKKPQDFEFQRQTSLWDDFVAYLDTYVWTKGGSGTVALNSSSPVSALKLTGTSSANSQAWFSTTNKFWEFQANKPLWLTARINFQQANTNNAGLFIGFSSLWSSTLLQDTTLIPATSFSGAGFYLPAGATNWSVITSVGSTQVLTATLEAAGPSADQYLAVQCDIVGTNIESTFMIGNADNVGGFSGPTTPGGVFPTGLTQARESTSGYNKPIKHRVPYSGAAVMGGGVFLKQASTTAESILVDYFGMLNLR